MKNKFAERLNKAMEVRRVKPKELSEMTGIDKGAISCYRSGKYRAGTDNLYLIAEALRVNPAWLMGSNEVPMDAQNISVSTMSDTAQILSEILVRPTDFETEMIVRYREADSKTKKAIIALLSLEEF